MGCLGEILINALKVTVKKEASLLNNTLEGSVKDIIT